MNYLPAQIFSNNPLSIPVSINNLNGQPQKGNVKVSAYALKNAGEVYKKRLWDNPDQFIINKADFKRYFPGYAYGNEAVISSWPRLNKVDSLNIKVDEDKPGVIAFDALKKQPSGMYQVVINASSQQGDTISVTKYVELINSHAKPVSFDDWVIPVVNDVKRGANAEFLLGIDQDINVLMERYNGAKLVSSQWISFKNGQQNIRVPVADTDKDVAVQFLMVYQNRVYSRLPENFYFERRQRPPN